MNEMCKRVLKQWRLASYFHECICLENFIWEYRFSYIYYINKRNEPSVEISLLKLNSEIWQNISQMMKRCDFRKRIFEFEKNYTVKSMRILVKY